MDSLNPQVQVSEQDIQRHKKIEKEVRKVILEMTDEVDFVLSSGPNRTYFLGESDKKQKLKQMNLKYNNFIQSKLLNEIEVGLTKVNKVKTSYVIQPKSQPTTVERIEDGKIKIMLKKKQAIEALNEIIKEENDIVKQRNSLLQKSRTISKSPPKIYENPEWRQHLVQAIKRNKDLDKSLEKKDEQVEKKAIQINEQRIKSKLEKLQKQRALHQEQLQRRKIREEKQKEKEQQYRKKCVEFVHKMRPSKYRFEIMGEIGEQKMKFLEEQREQKIKEYKQLNQRKDWKELQDHQQKYFETISERKQQWLRKFESSFGSRVDKKYNSSIFARRLQQAESQKQFEEQQRQNRKKVFQQKIKHYNSQVLQKHMPRKLIKSSYLHDKNTSVRRGLNRQQEREKGLVFLTEAKKKHKDIKNTQLKGASSLPVIKAPTYKDYLKQQPKRVKDSSSFHSILTEKKGDWALNAKSILQRLDKTHKSGDKVMLQSAFKKIQLLNAIM